MRMFKHTSRVAVALLVFQFIAPANAVDVPAVFNFTGAGYGHGVGMSQIGAKARAVAGESATAILKYYYKNVDVVPVPDTATIRVNIGHALKTVTFSTTTAGTSLQLFSGELLVGTTANKKKLTLTLSPDLKTIQGYNSSLLTLKWSGGATPVVTVTESGTTERFRYGQINIKVVKGALEVTTSLALHDEYLLGSAKYLHHGPPQFWRHRQLHLAAMRFQSWAESRRAVIATFTRILQIRILLAMPKKAKLALESYGVRQCYAPLSTHQPV